MEATRGRRGGGARAARGQREGSARATRRRKGVARRSPQRLWQRGRAFRRRFRQKEEAAAMERSPDTRVVRVQIAAIIGV